MVKLLNYADRNRRSRINHIPTKVKQLYYTYYIDRVALVCEVGRTWTFLFRFFRQIQCRICRIVFHHAVACSIKRNTKRKKNQRSAWTQRERKINKVTFKDFGSRGSKGCTYLQVPLLKSKLKQNRTEIRIAAETSHTPRLRTGYY